MGARVLIYIYVCVCAYVSLQEHELYRCARAFATVCVAICVSMCAYM